ncbi:MAG: NAD(P)H-dependent glycerol-3-phosphate dehydrogenase [Syntrophomonadaceae bacterium]|nr:NAD(P)H-dependent glycerol-3-phosphate dehydrogenase [Syntrophomonadaceae bacterium]
MARVCILGSGSWGTALAVLLAKNGHQVLLWGRLEDGIESIAIQRENSRFLPVVTIPPGVTPLADMEAAIGEADWLILSLPSQALRPVLTKAGPYITPRHYIVNTAKGLEIDTGYRLSQVTEEVLGTWVRARYAVLSGPSHAEEVGRGVPTAVTAAACHHDIAEGVQDLFMAPVFRVYTNPDIAGVELGGALKNIIALSTGIAYGLGFGDNTMAALLTRGLAEMVRMGKKMGGNPRTFSGLSGLGDLVVTCGSRHSRNRRAGELIGQGQHPKAALDSIGMVVEGAYTCQIVDKIARESGIIMPITRACYQVLYEDRDPLEVVSNLMQRQKKYEMDEYTGLPGWD